MTSAPGIDVRKGDLFASSAQTLVNTVNTVGVMGKGVALGFKQRFPEMYRDYVQRCEARPRQARRALSLAAIGRTLGAELPDQRALAQAIAA